MEPEHRDGRCGVGSQVDEPEFEARAHDLDRKLGRGEFPPHGFDLGDVLWAQTAQRAEQRLAIGFPLKIGFDDERHLPGLPPW